MINQQNTLAFIKSAILLIFIANVFTHICYQLYAFFLMGPSENAFWMFNVDTAYRLTHAHQVLSAESYPPPSISNMDVSFHYHYGGAAIAAFISNLFSIDVYQAYFYVLMPVVFTLGMLLLYFIAIEKTKSKLFAFSIMAVYMLYRIDLSKLYDRIHGISHEIVYFLISRDTTIFSEGFTHSDPQRFGNGIFDISYLVLYVSIPLFVSILFVKDSYMRLIFWLVFALCAIHLKTELFLLTLVLIVFEICYVLYLKLGFKLTCFIQFLFLILLLIILPGNLIPLFGYEIQYSFRELSFPLFGYALWIQVFILLSILLIVVDKKKLLQSVSGNSVTCFWFIYISLIFLIFVNFTNIQLGNGGIGTLALSSFLPRACTAIFMMALLFSLVANYKVLFNNSTKNQVIMGSFLPVLVLVILLQLYHNIHQFYVLVSSPESAHEAANVEKERECIGYIPRENTVVFMNNFDNPANNYKRKNNAMHITAMFGHQAYASNSAYERFDFVKDRLKVQGNVLTGLKSSLTDVCDMASEVESYDKYIYFDKRKGIPSFIYKDILFENAHCLVYKLDQQKCLSIN